MTNDLDTRDFTGTYCHDCGNGLWTARAGQPFERPTSEPGRFDLVCETCFTNRPFGANPEEMGPSLPPS